LRPSPTPYRRGYGPLLRSSFPHRGLCRSSAKERQPPRAEEGVKARLPRTFLGAVYSRSPVSTAVLARIGADVVCNPGADGKPFPSSCGHRSELPRSLPPEDRAGRSVPRAAIALGTASPHGRPAPSCWVCVPSLRTSSRASRAAALIFTLCLRRRRPGPSSGAATRSRSRFLRDRSEKRPLKVVDRRWSATTVRPWCVTGARRRRRPGALPGRIG
jgi:hypothetical protein